MVAPSVLSVNIWPFLLPITLKYWEVNILILSGVNFPCSKASTMSAPNCTLEFKCSFFVPGSETIFSPVFLSIVVIVFSGLIPSST